MNELRAMIESMRQQNALHVGQQADEAGQLLTSDTVILLSVAVRANWISFEFHDFII